MKKIFAVLVLFLTGCTNLMNTPIKRVEELLYKYQSFDDTILLELESNASGFLDFSEEEKSLYIAAMKRQYTSLSYDIKDEVIDGNVAEVTVVIEVYDYNLAIKKISLEEDYDFSKITKLQLESLLGANDKIIYHLSIYLTKIDGVWKIDGLVEIDKQKLMGIYNN